MSAEPKPEKPHVKSSSSSLTKGHDEVGDMMHHGKKPCRSCVDFKSWTKHTKKAQNTVIVVRNSQFAVLFIIKVTTTINDDVPMIMPMMMYVTFDDAAVHDPMNL